MTDQPHDDELLGAKLAAQEKLYNAALESPITEAGVNWLFRAHLLLKIADDDVDAAKEVIHTLAGEEAAKREFDALSDHERASLKEHVGLYWSVCVRSAVERLWHAALVLKFDPTTVDRDYIALTAATLVSGKPGPFEDDEAKAA
jgi:hypothetical protein